MKVHIPVAACLAMLFVSCAPQHPKDMQRIEALRVEAERYLRARTIMEYEFAAFGTPYRSDSLAGAFANLFTQENIDLARRAEEDEPDSVQHTRLLMFRRFLITGYYDSRTASLADSAMRIEASAKLEIGEDSLPFRQVSELLARQKDQHHRALLSAAAGPVVDSIRNIGARARREQHRVQQELGYSSYDAMAADLGWSLNELGQAARQVLVSTDSLYRSLLKKILAERLKLSPGTFHAYDAPALLSGREFDRYFRTASMLPTLRATYSTCSISLDSLRGIAIDTADRPAKSHGCYPVDIPDDIRVTVTPIGGFAGYRALFHEAGPAIAYANCAEHAFEFRYLGDRTVPGTYAYLSEYLLSNQAWLRIRTRMPVNTLKDFVRLEAFARLYRLRRSCALFLNDLRLHQDTSATAVPQEQASVATLSDALGFSPDQSADMESWKCIGAPYHNAISLRALFLEAQLNAMLSRRFGANWFEYPQAGEYLHSLWAHGGRDDGADLARAIGSGSIDPTALLSELRYMLLFSTK